MFSQNPLHLREKLGMEYLPDYMSLCWKWGLWYDFVSAFPIDFNVFISSFTNM